MSRDDHDKPDPDRAAILSRRKQFIALALSGLATTACTDGKQDGKSNDPARNKPPKETRPEACLSVPFDYEPPEPIPPQVCLKMAIPDEEPPQPEPEPIPPQVCLKMAVPDAEPPQPKPKPCLSMKPPPQPCLKKSAPD